MSRDKTMIGAIAVCGVDFGWGSAGKISAILEEIRDRGDMRVVMIGTALGRPVLLNAQVDVWVEDWPTSDSELRQLMRDLDVVAALVILDPYAASKLESVGIPTLYIDSIPYVWTMADFLPTAVSIYCAQRSRFLPAAAEAALRRVSNVTWIDAIVTVPVRDAVVDRELAILNFGGMHSPTHVAGNPVYLSLVVMPVLKSLVSAGYRRVEVCGNLAMADLGHGPEALSLDLHVNPRSHEEFMALLGSAGVLLTSPGLTALLEASACGCPTVCLPPQNLSQIFNAQRFAKAVSEELVVSWPRGVVDSDRLDKVRGDGEGAALTFIDASLTAIDPESIHADLSRQVKDSLSAVELSIDWQGLIRESGNQGALEVADLLRDLAVLGPST